jgi:ABC-type multidrug transport system fused ATPase/permease subunit
LRPSNACDCPGKSLTEAEEKVDDTNEGKTEETAVSAVVDADHILVLKQGRVVEQGNHTSLLELNGWYAAQWRYQQLEASLDAA